MWDLTLNLLKRSGTLSRFALTTMASSWNSSATSFTMPSMIWHGPQLYFMKSTRTGFPSPSNCSNSAVDVNWGALKRFLKMPISLIVGVVDHNLESIAILPA